jgi:hypothetical protein
MREAVRHEWDDFLGVRVRVRRRPHLYPRVHHSDSELRPTGWNSPGVRKAIDIYFRVTLTIFKMLLAVPLSLLAIGAFWLFWICITLFYAAIVHRLVS